MMVASIICSVASATPKIEFQSPNSSGRSRHVRRFASTKTPRRARGGGCVVAVRQFRRWADSGIWDVILEGLAESAAAMDQEWFKGAHPVKTTG
jgi:hypothetical protein